ncbi:uncharacterized protein LOC120255015 [Dioscorea cayenensis subsp. rotundata]|uniref:Uncharacterized protein LOC120255015 n=1 Tax=Dioscorea cayennensis subsp. rotundata TaxID=55577 RepID=A0AB40AX32_DIOCR|nr:uncharacterized protein LOC120255015 [Dioscorea cayenensis subsp. rotundata]
MSNKGDQNLEDNEALALGRPKRRRKPVDRYRTEDFREKKKKKLLHIPEGKGIKLRGIKKGQRSKAKYIEFLWVFVESSRDVLQMLEELGGNELSAVNDMDEKMQFFRCLRYWLILHQVIVEVPQMIWGIPGWKVMQILEGKLEPLNLRISPLFVAL